MVKWTLWCALLAPLLAHAAPAAKTTPPMTPQVQPATGYWYDAERPGTGFAVERRGDMLGLVFYHFSDYYFSDVGLETRGADWHLANGPLQDNTVVATLLHFEGGSCLGCDPFAEADGVETDIVVRLEFTSAREATLTVGDGEPRRVVTMPYGVPYESALDTPADLPLPDLRGRWVLQDLGNSGVFTLTERLLVADGVEYRGEAATDFGRTAALMVCGAEQCELSMTATDGTVKTVPIFRRGDITEERMVSPLGLGALAFRVQGTEVQP
jgi:hypothetical protein